MKTDEEENKKTGTSFKDRDDVSKVNKDVENIQSAIIQNPRRIFKIIVIGDSNVGKTCLTFRFCGGKFLERSEATIGVDFREKTIEIDDEVIKLQIWDTGTKKIFLFKSISIFFYSWTREIQKIDDFSLLQKCSCSIICL